MILLNLTIVLQAFWYVLGFNNCVNIILNYYGNYTYANIYSYSSSSLLSLHISSFSSSFIRLYCVIFTVTFCYNFCLC